MNMIIKNKIKLKQFLSLYFNNDTIIERILNSKIRWQLLLTGRNCDNKEMIYASESLDEYKELYNSEEYIPIFTDHGSDDVIIYTGNEFIIGHLWTNLEYHDNGRFSEPQELLDWILSSL